MAQHVRGQGPAAQHPEKTDDSYDLAAGACPIEDGTLGSQGCPTDSCMPALLCSPRVYSTGFSSPPIYFKLTSSHPSTQLQTAPVARKQRGSNGVPRME